MRFKWIKRLAVFALVVLCFGLITVGGIIYYLSRDLPSLEGISRYEPSQASRIYAADGRVVEQFFVEKRVYVPLSRMSKFLIQAVLAVEDARFYQHVGIDYRRMIKAAFTNIEQGKIREGASTITQQLTRSLFLTPERTLQRKAKEILLSLKIERTLTKDQILEFYLNQVYFGHGAYGAQVASRTYFGKDVSRLTHAEAAMLAGVLKAPTRYSPYTHPKRAKARQQIVLRRMRQEGLITDSEMKQHVFRLQGLPKEEALSPHFVEYIRQYLSARYGNKLLYKGGLNVYTTLDIEMQRVANKAIREGLRRFDKRKVMPRVEGALVAIEPGTGHVKAMVGGADFETSKFNRAITSRRQPGSAFKPFVYAAAIERGLTPATVIIDSPIIQQSHRKVPWMPKNYDEQFHGPTRLREGLTFSRNLVTIKLLQEVGVGQVVALAHRVGIQSPLTATPSLALGTSGVSLLELTSAYSVFANQGIRAAPVMILSVVDQNRHVLERTRTRPQRVLSRETAYITTNMLEDVIQRGTGKRARNIGRPVAGKTGTTNDFTDAWFVGFTPSIAVGVWVGYDNNRSLGPKETGAATALPIWQLFMEAALGRLPVVPFSIPENIVYAKIDPDTGLLAAPGQETAIVELFVRGTEPTEVVNLTPGPSDFFELDILEEEL